MNLDDDICYCYHVPLRKLINFAKQRDLKRPSQMSDCFGAGTGCGWCIPILKMIYEKSREEKARLQNGSDAASGQAVDLSMTPEEYARQRDSYRSEKRARNTFEPGEHNDTIGNPNDRDANDSPLP